MPYEGGVDCIAKPNGNMRRDFPSFQKILSSLILFFFFFQKLLLSAYWVPGALLSVVGSQSCKDRVVQYHWRELGFGSSTPRGS